MNIDAINKVIDLISSKEPERVLMGGYYSDPSAKCGTAACIAGWTLMSQMAWADIQDMSSFRKDIKAAEILDIDISLVRWQLFYMKYMPGEDTLKFIELGMNYQETNRACSSRTFVLDLFDSLPAPLRKQTAINVLTTLRDTGEVDWLGSLQTAVLQAAYKPAE